MGPIRIVSIELSPAVQIVFANDGATPVRVDELALLIVAHPASKRVNLTSAAATLQPVWLAAGQEALVTSSKSASCKHVHIFIIPQLSHILMGGFVSLHIIDAFGGNIASYDWKRNSSQTSPLQENQPKLCVVM